MKKIFLAVIAAISVLGTLTSCDSKTGNSTTSGAATIVCDKSFENIMNQEIDVFESIYPKVSIGCQYVSQAEALQRLLSGDTRMAVVGRDLTNAEKDRLKRDNKTKNVRSMKIAVDAVALIVNPENPVSKLSMEEISNILSGKINNWSQIQPGAPDKRIRVMVDDPGSGLATYMRDKLMKGAPFDTNVVVNAGSVKAIFERVKTSPYAIGVIGVSWLTTDLSTYSDHNTADETEKLVAELKNDEAIDGAEINKRMEESGVKTIRVMNNSMMAYAPSQENIYSGDYPLTRPIFMITTASPGGPLGGFYSFVTGKDGQRLIMKTGIMPARVNVQVYEVN